MSTVSQIRRVKGLLHKLARLSLFTLKYNIRRKLRLFAIKEINFNAIDVCNSHCQMCNIWQKKEDKKLSPEEFAKIFEDDLFKNVMHVGITGGEPTLRDDLVEVYSKVIRGLKKLKGLSIITNAINGPDVSKKIIQINNLCKENNISFSAMISLDGVGAVHDKIRGTPGNFNNSIGVINELSSQGIPVSIGCTISANNVWDMNELLYFLKKNKIYGRFRIAEYIKRLYNENSRVIRRFGPDEVYQLATFFHKLELEFETDALYKRTYRNIRHMLLGGKRKVGCPYHSEAVVLGAEGQLNYCAPKSNSIGNALMSSANGLYKKSLKEREEIQKKYCADCIHDYHYPELLTEYVTDSWEKLQLKFFHSLHIEKAQLYMNLRKWASLRHFSSRASAKKKRILIVGWYGTETVGDKAILAGIIQKYKESYGDVQFTIGSSIPYITERTLKELNLGAAVVNSRTFSLFTEIERVDEVVMGGGPLMDLEDLMIPHNAFYYAKLVGKKTTVFGCGVGPLTEERYETLVKKIFLLSDEIFLRDQDSVKKANQYLLQAGVKKDVKLSGDPARVYLKSLSEQFSAVTKKNELVLFLRDWTYEYGKRFSYEDFEKAKRKFEIELRDIIVVKARELKVEKIRFCHMHNFVIGNDDRDFSLRFIDEYMTNLSEFEIVYDKKLSTVGTICEAMAGAKFNICMRFHSVVFAETLGVEYGAVDYTFGGKINSFLNDNSSIEKLIPIFSIGTC